MNIWHFLLFELNLLMLAGPRLNISQEFTSKCKEIYYTKGHSDNSWKIEIRNLAADFKNQKKYFDFIPSSEKEVSENLANAREIIQNKLDKDAGNHLCLPWTIGNFNTIKIIKDLEIKSCFWGVLPMKKNNEFNNDEFFIPRIKNDFIFRLPGKDRKSLFSIYYCKFSKKSFQRTNLLIFLFTILNGVKNVKKVFSCHWSVRCFIDISGIDFKPNFCW